MAVLLVLLRHAGVPHLQGGFVGVDVFFVVSGFLITGILLKQARRDGSISLAGFYSRRARRIVPAALLTLAVTDVVAYVLLNFVRARDAVWDSVFATFFAANFRFADVGTDYFAHDQPPSPLLHYWSLGVEEQFYLVWPALLSAVLFGAAMFARRRHVVRMAQERRVLLVVVVLSTASLAWSVRETSRLPVETYFSPFARAWELGIGAALALSAPFLARTSPAARLVLGWLGLVAIALAAVCFSDGTAFPGYAALLPTVGTALVIVAGIAETRRLSASGVLGVAPMRAIGDRSYALYLWHWPVLILAALYAGHDLSARTNLLLLVGAVILSFASYALVENPIRHARWSAGRTGLAFALATTAMLVLATAALAGVDRREARFEARTAAAYGESTSSTVGLGAAPAGRGSLPAVVAAVEAARRGDPIPTGLAPPIGRLRNEPTPYVLSRGCVPPAASSQTSSLVCRIGRASSARTIVVVGDSHAQMWMPAIVRLGERDGWAVVPLLRPGCTPDTWIGGDGPAACRPWYRWAVGEVQALRPSVVLVSGDVSEFSGAAARESVRGILALARAVEPYARDTAVIGDPQGLRRNPIDCLLSSGASMRTCTAVWPASRLAAYELLEESSTARGLGFIDTAGWFCYQRACPPVIARTIAYRDPHHISAAYALRLAANVRFAFHRVVRTR